MSGKDFSFNDLAHYAVVLGGLGLAWQPLMGFAGGNATNTLILAYPVFIAIDKAAHKLFGLN